MAANLPPCPASLKPIMHHLKVATEHDERNPVIAYWCRLHALQTGIKLSAGRKNKDETILLGALMDWLETKKKENADNDAFTNDMCAQAAIEEYVLKLFKYADEQDRAEKFDKNLVKAFYTSGIVMDVLGVFGEIPEDIQEKQKYAKWKAAYIHNCLRSGERPIPGPLGGNPDPEDVVQPNEPGFSVTDPSPVVPVTPPEVTPSTPTPAPFVPPTTSYQPFIPPTDNIAHGQPSAQNDNVTLGPDLITKAQKYCKYAGSALNYEDVKTAKLNLHKALALLETGVDSA